MKSIIILGLLCTMAFQQTVLISSSPDNTIITDPPNAVTTIDGYYALHYPDYIGYNAKWIYKNGTGGWPVGDYAVLFTEFYVDCSKVAATLIITADDSFSVSLNGGTPYTGCDWQRIYKFNLDCLKCGVNTLTIKVTNTGKNSPAAVIFAVVQDQTNCYNCSSPLSYYNKKTCQCECIDHCDCTSINPCYTFFDYPICGCKCKKVECCPPYQYFNEDTCKCECQPAACLPGYKFDNSSCKCVSNCPKQDCDDCHVWNPYQCKCVCPNVLICKKDEYWDTNECKCKCSNDMKSSKPHH